VVTKSFWWSVACLMAINYASSVIFWAMGALSYSFTNDLILAVYGLILGSIKLKTCAPVH
jgi:hypothetical protein